MDCLILGLLGAYGLAGVGIWWGVKAHRKAERIVKMLVNDVIGGSIEDYSILGEMQWYRYSKGTEVGLTASISSLWAEINRLRPQKTCKTCKQIVTGRNG